MTGEDNFEDPADAERSLERNKIVHSVDGKRMEKYENGRLVTSWPVGAPPPNPAADEQFNVEFDEAVKELRAEDRKKKVEVIEKRGLSTWASRKAKK